MILSQRKWVSLLSISFLIPALVKAGDVGSVMNSQPISHWFITGGLGYTWFAGGYNGDNFLTSGPQAAIGDGQTPFGRFSIGRELFPLKSLPINFEIGVQNGNVMRANISQTTLDEIGGVHPQLNIKPMLDFLFTTDVRSNEFPSYFIPLKLGIAYRRMQIDDRVTFNDLSQVAFEIQAGIGYTISERAAIFLTYQGIFDGATAYTINTTTSTGSISNIPKQNGLMLNARLNF